MQSRIESCYSRYPRTCLWLSIDWHIRFSYMYTLTYRASLANQCFLVSCFHFSFSISPVDENLLNFSCSFSHLLVLVTANDITKYRVRHNHTVRSTHCCQLSSTRIYAVSYDRLTKSSNKMWTKTSRISVLLSVIWSNFRHNFSFVDEN